MSNSKLYVGNLSFKTTEDELRSAFGQFGSVTDVYVAMDKMTGKDVWTAPTKETTGTPMTYQTRSGRQFVLICTGRSTQATLAAFALPSGTAPSAAPKADRRNEH
jgi:hypothetical protein